jgi:hypothetical protein
MYYYTSPRCYRVYCKHNKLISGFNALYTIWELLEILVVEFEKLKKDLNNYDQALVVKLDKFTKKKGST